MEKVTFTNSLNQAIEIASAPFRLITISGTGGTPAEVQTQKAPFQDGETFIDALLGSRPINIDGAIYANSKIEASWNRDELIKVFNPKLGLGTLRFEYDGGVKEIQAIASEPPFFPQGVENRIKGYQKFGISLACPTPFWLDIELSFVEMVSWVDGFKFPIVFPAKFSNINSTMSFNNQGHISAPVTIEFYGPATNPKVENLTTNEFIKVSKTLLDGEKLVITTEFGNKTVVHVAADGTETDVMNWLDVNSVFWQLEAGENIIRFTADTGADSARVRILWKNRYLGV